MRCLFLSDAHYPRNDIFIDFLIDNYNKYDNIYILGDLFEFYYGYENFFYPHHIKLINALNIISNKTRLVLFEGNHEYRLEKIKQFVNAEVIKDSLIEQIDGKKVFMQHGDTIDTKDLSYRIFRNSLKNSLTLSVINKISPTTLFNLSKSASSFSKKITKSKKIKKIDEAFLNFAKNRIKGGADIVILAHTHRPSITKIDKGLYINSGDFFDNLSYITYETKRGFLLNFYERGKK